MDNTVIILIGIGVCCIVTGFVMFIRLLKVRPGDGDEGPVNIVPDDYADNFEECFANTGNIEETLDQLLDIYSEDKEMSRLISDAINYIQNGYGEYETALEIINADQDERITEMHNRAIRKVIGADEDEEPKSKRSSRRSAKSDEKKKSRRRKPADEDEEEDEEEEPEEEPKKTRRSSGKSKSGGSDGSSSGKSSGRGKTPSSRPTGRSSSRRSRDEEEEEFDEDFDDDSERERKKTRRSGGGDSSGTDMKI